MRHNLFMILGIVWIVILVTLVAAQVGEIPECSSTVWQWWDAGIPLVIAGVPFLLGYFGGRADNENS